MRDDRKIKNKNTCLCIKNLAKKGNLVYNKLIITICGKQIRKPHVYMRRDEKDRKLYYDTTFEKRLCR